MPSDVTNHQQPDISLIGKPHKNLISYHEIKSYNFKNKFFLLSRERGRPPKTLSVDKAMTGRMTNNNDFHVYFFQAGQSAVVQTDGYL